MFVWFLSYDGLFTLLTGHLVFVLMVTTINARVNASDVNKSCALTQQFITFLGKKKKRKGKEKDVVA